MATKQTILTRALSTRVGSKSSITSNVTKKASLNVRRKSYSFRHTSKKSENETKVKEDIHGRVENTKAKRQKLKEVGNVAKEVGNVASQIPKKIGKWNKTSETFRKKKDESTKERQKSTIKFQATTQDAGLEMLKFDFTDKDTLKMDMFPLTEELQHLTPTVPEGVVDIDSGDSDVFLCKEYAQDIMQHLKKREEVVVLTEDFMDHNPDVRAKTRGVLTDWLIQVQAYLALFDSTLQMGVHILDQFLSKQRIKTSQLQLVGVTSLFIAAKLEERFAPEVENLIRLTENAYSYEDVIAMEITILEVLKFDVHYPAPGIFLDRLCLAVPVDRMMTNLCYYMLDLTLTDHMCSTFPPSLRAAASLCLSRHILEDNDMLEPWTPSLAYYSTYSETDMMGCMKRMAKALLKVEKSRHQGARQKFSSKSKFGAISLQPILKTSPVLHDMAEDCPVTPK